MVTLSNELVLKTQKIYESIPEEVLAAYSLHMDELREHYPSAEPAKKTLEIYFEGNINRFRRAWENDEFAQEKGISLEAFINSHVAQNAVVLRTMAFDQYVLEAKLDADEVFAMHCTTGNIWQQECYLINLMVRIRNRWGIDKACDFMERYIDDEITPPETRYLVIIETLNQLS